MSETASENQPRRIDQLAGMGLVSSYEIGEQMGLSFIAIEQIGEIYRRQADWFFADQRDTLALLGQTMNPLSAWVDHVERRSRHINEGLRELVDTVGEITSRSADTRRRAWDPLARMAGVRELSALTRQNVIDRLEVDHKRLSQCLSVMEKLGADPAALKPKERDVLASAVRYVSEYPDSIHHPLEDRLFEHLLELPLTSEERNDVEKNAASHQSLIEATSSLRDRLAGLDDGGEDGVERFKSSLATYIDLQRRHMAFEEARVFKLARQRLPHKALRDLSDEDTKAQDPMFDQQLERYESLYFYVSGQL